MDHDIFLGSSANEDQPIPFTEIQVNQLSNDNMPSLQHGAMYSMVH